MAEDYKWNISQIAAAAGLHRDTVRKRLAECGIKSCGKRGNAPVYHLAEAMQALFAQAVVSADNCNPDKLAPKERLDHWRAESERVKFAQTVRELVPSHEVRDDLAETLKAVAGWFESLPDKMERTKGFTPAQLELLEKACDEFRENLYELIVGVDE